VETAAAPSEEAAATEAPPAVEEPAPGRWDRFDSLIVAAAAIATFLVHPVHLVLSRQYWLDEAWLAVLTKVPITHLPRYSAIAPFGFVALLRFVPGSGPQRGRLVVLAFSAATVVMAYVVVRRCGWTSKWFARGAATAAALVVMLAPLSLGRNDLKAYTSDAFCALLIFAVAIRVDRPPGNTPVWWLSVASLAALPFSSTSAFVSAAAFAGLLGSALSTRVRRRIIETLVTGAATGVALAAFFGGVVIPNTNSKLRGYWNAYYLGGSPLHVLHESWRRLSALRPAIGMPTVVFVVLFVAGIAVLVKLQARAVAIAIPLLWIEMALAARLRRYPFLDLRTSHFLLVSSLVVCTIGAAGLVYVLAQFDRRVGGAVGGAIGAVLVAIFVAGNASHVHDLKIPYEDARGQTEYVAAHRRAHDVILVNQAGSFAFAYYWPHGRIVTGPAPALAQNFLAYVDGLDALYATGRTDAAVLTALRTATDRLQAAGPDSHLFIVRSHLNGNELLAWRRAFATLHLHPRTIHTGVEQLLEIGPA